MSDSNKSDVEEAVRDIRKLYGQVRSLERTVNRAVKFMDMFGAAIPTLGMLPHGFAVLFAFQIATLVAQQITALMQADMERRFEEERRKMYADVYAILNEEDRKLYRELVPEG